MRFKIFHKYAKNICTIQNFVVYIKKREEVRLEWPRKKPKPRRGKPRRRRRKLLRKKRSKNHLLLVAMGIGSHIQSPCALCDLLLLASHPALSRKRNFKTEPRSTRKNLPADQPPQQADVKAFLLNLVFYGIF